MAEAECAVLERWLALAGVDEAGVRAVVGGALEATARQRFDAPTGSALMRPAPPAWLAQMLGEPRLRMLLYTLCEQHPSCLLLQHGVRAHTGGH